MKYSFFQKPAAVDPYRYLKDFGKIEGYTFGRWRPIAITFWTLTALLSLSASLFLWGEHSDGADVFIQARFRLMSNLVFAHADAVVNVPLLEPASYICFAVFAAALLMTLKALFVRTVVRIHRMPSEKSEARN